MASSNGNNPSVSDGDGRNNGESLRSEDAEWLSSLSEPELDFLISLKELASRRAKNIGHGDLARRFDVRMLRALGGILLEYFKERLQGTSVDPNLAEKLTLLNACGLASSNCQGNSGSVVCTEDATAPDFATPRRKRMWEGLCEERNYRCKKLKRKEKDV